MRRKARGVVTVWALCCTLVACGDKAERKPQASASATSSTSVPSEPGSLRFDGLYISPDQGDGANHFIRFFSSGTVLTVSSTGNASQVAEWLVPGKSNVERGSYNLQGNDLSFTSSGELGSVDYQGSVGVEGVTLELNIVSHINGNRSTRTFRYVAD